MLRRNITVFAVGVVALATAAAMLLLLQPPQLQLPTYERVPISALHPGQRLAQAELLEQRRSADAAQAQAVVATYVAKLALWGTVGGFLTLIAAASAAVYAREAAKAARENLEAFTDVERASIVLSLVNFGEGPGVGIIEGGRNTFPNPTLKFEVRANNLGRSTALVAHVVHAWSSGPDLPNDLLFHGDSRAYIVGPGASVVLQLSGEALLEDFKKARFLWIMFAYRGPLQTDRVVRTCYEVWGARSNVPYREVRRDEWNRTEPPGTTTKGRRPAGV